MIQGIDELCNQIAAGHAGVDVARLSKGVRIGGQIFRLQPDPYGSAVRLSLYYGKPTTPREVELLCQGVGSYLLGFMASELRLAHEVQPGDIRYFVGLGPQIPEKKGHAFLTELGFEQTGFTGWTTEYALGEKYANTTLVLPWNTSYPIRLLTRDEEAFASSTELRVHLEAMRRACGLCELLERTLGRPVEALEKRHARGR